MNTLFNKKMPDSVSQFGEQERAKIKKTIKCVAYLWVGVLITAGHPVMVSGPSDRSENAMIRVGAAAVEFQPQDTVTNSVISSREKGGQGGMLRAVATAIQGPPENTRIAIVALDIVAMGRDALDSAAREIEKKTGIPFDPDFPVMAFRYDDRSLAAVLFGHSTHNIGSRLPEYSPGFYE